MKPPALLELKRVLAETLVRSRLDYTDDLLILAAFLHDFRWRQGACASGIAGEWEALEEEGSPPGHFFNLYLHFPYCRSKCLFCLYASRVPPGQAPIDAYVPEAKREMGFFSQALSGISFRSFMVGGGTPSLLSEPQLGELLGCAFESFRFEEEGLRSIECNPASADPDKLRTLRRLGFNRISFGVQSLDSKVLARVGREYQDYDMVKRAVRGARQAGFEDLNLDLILGLLGDSLEGFLESFRGVAALRPTTITVCGLTLTDAYLRAMRTSREEYFRHYESLLPLALEGLRSLARLEGYGTEELSAGRGIWSLIAEGTPERLIERWERGEHYLGRPCSLLGLGPHSRSHVFGRLLYERLPGAFDPARPLYRSVRLSLKEEMALYVLYSLESESRLVFSGFKERFGKDVRDCFGLELKALRALGKIRLDPEGFSFLPVAIPERVFYGLFFLWETLASSPFSEGRLDRGLRQRLEQELEGSREEAAAIP